MKLSEEARKKRNEYHREYYRTHREQYAETKRRYWENKARAEQGSAPDGAETIEPDRGTDDNK